jgi:hypothetical protein
MVYQDYSKQNTWKKEAKPKKNLGGGTASGDYQKFLEYLEQSGQSRAFQRKILNAHLAKKSKGLQ